MQNLKSHPKISINHHLESVNGETLRAMDARNVVKKYSKAESLFALIYAMSAANFDPPFTGKSEHPTSPMCTNTDMAYRRLHVAVLLVPGEHVSHGLVESCTGDY